MTGIPPQANAAAALRQRAAPRQIRSAVGHDSSFAQKKTDARDIRTASPVDLRSFLNTENKETPCRYNLLRK